MINTTESKKRIYYIREYRHFAPNGKETALFLLTCVVPIALIMLIAFPLISHWICNWAGSILSQALDVEVGTQVHELFPHFKPVESLVMDGHNPSRTQVLAVIIVSLVLIIISWQVDANLRSVFIYLCMALYVLLASCLFFLFWPERFPYTLSQFSSLYMLQQASLCVILPTLLGIALSLIPTAFCLKYLAVIVCSLLDILVCGLRYVFYLYVLARFSYLYMASRYFSLGVLFDFIRMVLIFSFVAKRVSETMQKPEWRGKWGWV